MSLSPRKQDTLIVIAGLAISAGFSLAFNLAERIQYLLAKFEDIQLDEIAINLFVLAVLSIWFSNRRVKELHVETRLRKSAEEHLTSSRLLYKALFDNSLTGNCVLNEAGDILMRNTSFDDIFGSVAQIVNVGELFNVHWQALLKLLSTQKIQDYSKLTATRPDGAVCYVMARFIAVDSSLGIQSTEVDGMRFHAYFVDITEQCLGEQDLEKTLKENQYLARHAMQVQEQERKYIAQEVHDETGQYLTAIGMDALALQKSLPANAQAIVQRISANTAHVQQGIRALLKQLRPPALDALGLSEAIRQMLADWQQLNPTTSCELDMLPQRMDFSEEINIVAYRVVQESLTNINKHAEANQVKLTLTIDQTASLPCLMIKIEDNGIGMDMRKLTPGIGLVGMRERVESLNGQIEVSSNQIKSSVSSGTRIVVTIPLRQIDSSTYKPNISIFG